MKSFHILILLLRVYIHFLCLLLIKVHNNERRTLKEFSKLNTSCLKKVRSQLDTFFDNQSRFKFVFNFLKAKFKYFAQIDELNFSPNMLNMLTSNVGFENTNRLKAENI
ncbi:hypothetical protein BpHYR1_034770 [Brachionus plicatilis]|uniref:Uncharacterized protein n=1 Tax=Brachionus plicatilis TaxID=10195 RepID=A0A3M7S1Z5_BRAPC|nr:hypothetical protein BpHYR1_034770 [Brachionus plicatilis]